MNVSLIQAIYKKLCRMNIRQIIIDDILLKEIKVGYPWKQSEAMNLLNKGISESALRNELQILCHEGYLEYTNKTYSCGEYRPTQKLYDTFR